MTKKRTFILFLILLASLLLFSCRQTPKIEKEKMYRVTYKINDKSSGESINVKENTTLTDRDLPILEDKEGKYFVSWIDNSREKKEVISGEYVVTKDVTLTPLYDEYVTVSFDTNGNGGIKDKKVKKGSKLDKPFISSPSTNVTWYYNEIPWCFNNDLVTQNITLKAFIN